MAAQFVFYGKSVKEYINFIITIYAIRFLAKAIFSCLTKSEFKDNQYLYENRLHSAKRICIFSLNRLNNQKQFVFFNNIFNQLLCCAQLRFRETDLSTITLCSIEMNVIHKAFDNLFKILLRFPQSTDVNEKINVFSKSINILEDHYYSILQIAAKNPSSYLIFIDELRAMQSNFKQLILDKDKYIRMIRTY